MFRNIIFSGHMVDQPGRADERFPARREEAVRLAIYDVLRSLQATSPQPLQGLAGGANGGDILFHECCRALHIPSTIYLVCPPEQAKAQSVAPAGDTWAARFDRLLETSAVKILPEHYRSTSAGIWSSVNSWILEEALNERHLPAMIALWNSGKEDGEGGTGHMVAMARAAGLPVSIIDPRQC